MTQMDRGAIQPINTLALNTVIYLIVPNRVSWKRKIAKKMGKEKFLIKG